jgi:hypothetical protein
LLGNFLRRLLFEEREDYSTRIKNSKPNKKQKADSAGCLATLLLLKMEARRSFGKTQTCPKSCYAAPQQKKILFIVSNCDAHTRDSAKRVSIVFCYSYCYRFQNFSYKAGKSIRAKTFSILLRRHSLRYVDVKPTSCFH